MKGIFKTKGVNPESGKPNIIALMLSDELGFSISGGAMASGVPLIFGEIAPFKLEQWEELSEEEYHVKYNPQAT